MRTIKEIVEYMRGLAKDEPKSYSDFAWCMRDQWKRICDDTESAKDTEDAIRILTKHKEKLYNDACLQDEWGHRSTADGV